MIQTEHHVLVVQFQTPAIENIDERGNSTCADKLNRARKTGGGWGI